MTFLGLKLNRQSTRETTGFLKTIFTSHPITILAFPEWRRCFTQRASASVVLNFQHLKVFCCSWQCLLALLFRWDGLYLYMFSHV